MVVAGDEVNRGGRIGRHRRRPQQSRNQSLQQQRRSRDVAIVDFIAHVQCLRDERFDLEWAERSEGRSQRRRKCLRHPLETVDDLWAMGAEPQGLTQAFVEVAIGPVPVYRIEDNPHWHGRADNARHRADGGVMVTGLERNLSARG